MSCIVIVPTSDTPVWVGSHTTDQRLEVRIGSELVVSLTYAQADTLATGLQQMLMDSWPGDWFQGDVVDPEDILREDELERMEDPF